MKMVFFFLVLICAAFSSNAQTVLNYAINTSTGTGEISPFIYGANVLHNFPVSNVDNYYPGIPSRRFGGDRVTGYNWENNFSNGGSYVCDPGFPGNFDYCSPNDDALPYFHQVPIGNYQVPGEVLKYFHNVSLNNQSYSLIQLPMAGYVSRDGDGYVTVAQSAPSIRWVKVVNEKGAPFTITPDPNDANMYVDEEINFLLQTYGGSTSSNGVKAYEMDNEPDIWYADGVQGGVETGTHPRLFPQPLRVDTFLARSEDLAKTIKRMDPDAEAFGPALANYAGYYNLHFAPDWDNYSGTYPRFVEAYLGKMKEYSQAANKRLLDVFTLHWYSQEDGVDSDINTPEVAQRRMQAPRSLWDDTFVEDSWITQYVTLGQPIRQIPDLQGAIDSYYPGTKIGFTEWRFGTGDNISTGIATADALGIFGKFNVYFATFFEKLEGYAKSAFMIYRNYDNNNGKFGNKRISSSVNDVVKSSVYASLNDNSSQLHIIALNKTSQAIEGDFSIAGNLNFNSEVKAYGFSDGNPDITFLGSSNILSNNQFTYDIPPLSVIHFVLTNSSLAVTGGNLPEDFTLSQNFPNPFNPTTKIFFTVPELSHVEIKVYDVLGNEIRTLVNSEIERGTHSIIFAAEDIPSAVYFYRIEAVAISGEKSYAEVKKMVFLK
jgi:Glycoside hydrolase family 44